MRISIINLENKERISTLEDLTPDALSILDISFVLGLPTYTFTLMVEVCKVKEMLKSPLNLLPDYKSFFEEALDYEDERGVIPFLIEEESQYVSYNTAILARCLGLKLKTKVGMVAVDEICIHADEPQEWEHPFVATPTMKQLQKSIFKHYDILVYPSYKGEDRWKIVSFELESSEIIVDNQTYFDKKFLCHEIGLYTTLRELLSAGKFL